MTETVRRHASQDPRAIEGDAGRDDFEARLFSLLVLGSLAAQLYLAATVFRA